MELGTVTFFNHETGFGVIKDDEGEKYCFITASLDLSQKKLCEGQRVCFDVRKGLDGTMALHIKLR